MATAGHVSDIWRPDFAAAGGAFQLFSVLETDFSAFAEWPTLSDYDALSQRFGATTLGGQPISFVASRPKPRGRRRRDQAKYFYEDEVMAGRVPTRIGHWHDFFNALAWCLFPKTKAAMNARQAALGRGARNHEQNRLAMFDEGGIARLIWPGQDAPLDLWVGHALFEAAVRGQTGISGFAITLPCAADMANRGLKAQVAAADAALSAWDFGDLEFDGGAVRQVRALLVDPAPNNDLVAGKHR